MVVVFVVVLLMVPVLVVCATCIAALGLGTVLVLRKDPGQSEP